MWGWMNIPEFLVNINDRIDRIGDDRDVEWKEVLVVADCFQKREYSRYPVYVLLFIYCCDVRVNLTNMSACKNKITSINIMMGNAVFTKREEKLARIINKNLEGTYQI